MITSTNKAAFKVGTAGPSLHSHWNTDSGNYGTGGLPPGVSFVVSGSTAKLSGTPAGGTAGPMPDFQRTKRHTSQRRKAFT